MVDHIKIVMVGTTHPGNVGAAARAMKNMGLSQLVLVQPECALDEAAYARCSGAEDILDRCLKFDSLLAAIADCHYVAATSARLRTLSWTQQAPDELAESLIALAGEQQAAVVFGREHSGLTNDELKHCHALVNIPTVEGFSSLNVASAIQVICYEIRKAWIRDSGQPMPSMAAEPSASSADMEGYFLHLEQVLTSTGFLDPAQPRHMMARLRRLYLRSAPSRNEIKILRGILSSVEKFRR